MNPIYTARRARAEAESRWRMVDRDANSTAEQRREARRAYEQSKADYRAAFKQQTKEQTT
jgi:hypothetical protein